MLEVVERLRAALRRAAIAGGLLMLAGLLMLTAFGFGIAALHEVLLSDFSDEAAAAITAGILLVIAGIIGLIAITLLRRRRSPRPRPASASGGGDPSALLATALGGRTWTPLAVALVAGFAFGLSPEIRREAARLLRREAERRGASK